ncbi:MAG: hypothetical protein JRI73_11780 [Deltaproteobacteria bacterium]|nr:hypothetical protein [Deltaproteobacteria bacterium]
MGVRVREKCRGSGVFWVFINHEGRRRSLKAGNRDVAEEVADRLRIKLKDNPDEVFVEREKAKPTFKAMSEQWLVKVNKTAKKSTVKRYGQVLNDYVLPVVGSKQVDEIRKADIADALEIAQDKRKSTSTLGLIRSCFAGPLELAAFREMIPANPAHGILRQMGIGRKSKDKNASAGKARFFTPEEVNLFLETCKKGWPEYHEFFLFLFMTGTRLGEALAITWKDIN